jgi:antirestriction protein ArdC
MAKNNVAYEAVCSQIIAALEKGIIPWRKSWNQQVPMNAVSKRPYNGLNFFLLSMTFRKDPRWLTFKQAQDLGGNVKKGEKSIPVVFWKIIVKEEDGKKQSFPLLRYYNVFNVEQIEGVEFPPLDANDNALNTDAEDILAGYTDCPEYQEGASLYPAYFPTLDKVTMPPITAFDSSDEYYSTRFHEYVHSTGHPSRLNRKMTGRFDRESYSEEELIAELGAAFLCNVAGIDNTTENSAAYIASWLKVFKGDPTFVVHAASKAQKAADLILGRNQPEDKAEE